MVALRFALYFCISFVILSIPVGDETLYERLHRAAKPTTDKIIDETKVFGSNMFQSMKELGSKLFTNIVPRKRQSDLVRSSQSAVSKTRKNKNQKLGPDTTPEDSYTEEEKRLLEKILKETHY